MQGRPWLDFEWLAQVIYRVAHGTGGMAALWALKVALLGAAGLAALSIMRLHGLAAMHRAAGLVLWSAGVITYSDLRPDLFSMLLFTLILRLLEELRAGFRRASLSAHAGVFALFALWSNLHGGFIFGLVLIALYAAGAWLSRRLGRSGDTAEPAVFFRLAAAAAAGTLVNPYGVGPYLVALEHLRAGPEIKRFLVDWQPLAWRNAFHWPLWPTLAACLGLAAVRRDRKDFPLGLGLSLAFFAFSALQHGRLSSYLTPLAAVWVALLAKGIRVEGRALTGAAAAYGLFLAWVLSQFSWTAAFVPRFVPARAAEFIAGESAAFKGLRLYNPWEWGGYLGWRLAPGHRVFQDGRYIFHPFLIEERAASANPDAWQAWLAGKGVTAALVRETGQRFGGTPWHVFYMPPSRWALVYRDERSLLFVDRVQAPASWLKRHQLSR